MKIKWNIPMLIISVLLVVGCGVFYYYPKLQGELNTDLDAVYLDDFEPAYDYAGDLVSFTKENTIKDAAGNDVGKGIIINLADGFKGYSYPTFDAEYKINSKFDRLTGKIVLTGNANIKDNIIEIEIIADKSTTLYQTKWDITKQSAITLDIPLNKVRTLKLHIKSGTSYEGESLQIGLADFAVAKGTAKPGISYKDHKTETSNFSWRSLLLLPKPVNNRLDTKYIELFDFKHSMSIIDLAGSPEIYTKDFSGEISFYLLNKNKNDPLLLKAEVIALKGCTADISLGNDNLVNLKNIAATGKSMCIYIPKGTVISRDGYALQDDYIVKNVTIVPSIGIGIWNALKPYLPAVLIIIGLLLLISFVGNKVIKSGNDVPINACVINIAISFLLCFVVFGVPGLLENSFGRGGYGNDIGILILISAFVIPCATAIFYRLLMTWRYNIRSSGIIGGTFAFIGEILLTVTGVYFIGMLLGGTIFGAIAGVKEIMND